MFEATLEEGSQWITSNAIQQFDLIFADAWPGKYSELETILSMVKIGGFYVIDDMTEQSNWPEGHSQKASKLIQSLESLPNFHFTKLNWSTGVMVGVRNY
ncbi:MAG: hypothetical protein RJQ14_21715 [Marinoscillum sp.]